MEHLLNDQDYADLKHELDDIPWLGFDHDSTKQYDTVILPSYPLLRGWSQESLDTLKLERTPLSSLDELAMLQSWLFFGVWEAFLTRHLASKDFIFETAKGPVIRTRRLRGVIGYAESLISKSDLEDNERWATLLRHALDTAQYWNRVLVVYRTPVSEIKEDFDAIVQLTATCGETLKSIVELFPNEIRNTMPSYSFWLGNSKVEGKLHKRLEARGWCKSLFDYLINDTGLCTAEYATLMNTNNASPLDHRSCSYNGCFARRVDPRNYLTRHTIDCRRCDFRKPNVNSITLTYESGSFPLIDLDKIEGSQTISTDCVRSFQNCNDTPFVAISHVWSDGLCSDADTGLPACQVSSIKQLAALCKNESTSCFHLIYIDTLCIPRDENIKKMAINTMARVYSTASIVLVLDSTLRTVDVGSSSAARVLLQLLTSPWNHRLWTLQEALLARELVFAFHDGLYKAWDLWGRGNSIPTPIGYECRLKLGELLVKKHMNVVRIANLLRRRSSSVPEDEFLAVASLLEIPIEPLTSKEGEDRCCEFWTLLKHVPRSIVFQVQEKISIEGFRWAPRSLMGSKATSTMRADGDAIVTATHGLRGTYDLLNFQRRQHIDFTKYRLYLLIVVSRRQIFRLMAFSWDRQSIWCDGVLVERLKPGSSLVGQETTAAVCLSRKKENPGLDAPQYEYSLRCGMIHGLSAIDEPVDWDSVPGSESWNRFREMMDKSILCDVSEGQTIYLT